MGGIHIIGFYVENILYIGGIWSGTLRDWGRPIELIMLSHSDGFCTYAMRSRGALLSTHDRCRQQAARSHLSKKSRHESDDSALPTLYSLTALRCSPTAAKWVEIWGYVRLSADNLGISSLGTCSQFYGVLYQVQCTRCHSSAQEARAPGAGTSFQDRA
jgi:hypothetical protein